jgi:hypothetical protein
MPAGSYSFYAEQGATLERVITYTDSAGAIINLTGYTAKMQVRTSAESATVVLELTSSAGITINGTAGTLSILVAASVLSAIAPLIYVYDLEITAPSGKVTRLIEGRFYVKAEVTR